MPFFCCCLAAAAALADTSAGDGGTSIAAVHRLPDNLSEIAATAAETPSAVPLPSRQRSCREAAGKLMSSRFPGGIVTRPEGVGAAAEAGEPSVSISLSSPSEA